MQRIVLVAIFFGSAALAVPPAAERYLDRRPSEAALKEMAPPAAAPAEETGENSRHAALAGRRVVLRADADGHFRGEARINGRPLPVLIDTGATYVAFDEETAQRLGVRLRPDDFVHTVATANGSAAAALARLERVELGGITLFDVDAIVTREGTLSVALLGMSYLKGLSRVQIDGDRLTLER